MRHHHEPGDPLPSERHVITYRGWTIDRWIQPDGCHYGYAPDYDGADPNQTKLGRSLVMLCDEIDAQIAEWEQWIMASDFADGTFRFKPSGSGDYIVYSDCLTGVMQFVGYVEKAGKVWEARYGGRLMGSASSRERAAELLVTA